MEETRPAEHIKEGAGCGGRIRLPKDGTGRLRAEQGGPESMTWRIPRRRIRGGGIKREKGARRGGKPQCAVSI